jgi:hypothetical protein
MLLPITGCGLLIFIIIGFLTAVYQKFGWNGVYVIAGVFILSAVLGNLNSVKNNTNPYEL